MACLNELTTRITELNAGQPFATAWSLIVPDGKRTNCFGTRRVPAASTRKVAILLTALAAARRGRLRLDQRIIIDERYRSQLATGTLQHLQPGLGLSLLDALTLMIIWSDNLCTAHVLDVLGLDEVNRFCDLAGLRDTRHLHAIIPRLDPGHPVEATNYTTADDQARLLDLLRRGCDDAAVAAPLGLDPASCARALTILRAQQHDSMLPGLLPPQAVVAHKPGAGWSDVGDIGIVYRDDRALFVLAAYAVDVPEMLPDGVPGYAAAQHHIARLCRLAWDVLAARSEQPPAVGA
jgi:beta-lactamase class A